MVIILAIYCLGIGAVLLWAASVYVRQPDTMMALASIPVAVAWPLLALVAVAGLANWYVAYFGRLRRA